MKINLTILLLLLIINISYAQKNAFVLWNCVQPDSNKVSQIDSDLSNATLSGKTMVIRDYTGVLTDGITGGPLGKFQRWYTNANWPNDNEQNNSRYIQFSVAPKSGSNFTVSQISFYINAGGTSAMKANYYYSNDTSFASMTKINATEISVSRDLASETIYTMNFKVETGKSFYFRIYPWLPGGSTNTGKYIYLQKMQISGVLNSSGVIEPLTVTTTAATNVLRTSATLGGNVISDGGKSVTAKGVCWNESGNPTLQNSNANMGSGIGSYSSQINNLKANTKYFVRAFATNSDQTVYGNEISFTTLPTAIPAFPGAEGFGKYTTGGRGGAVYEVTNLNDDNLPGSLRWAINQSGVRTIIFKVSGTIQLKSNLTISKGDVTIAGQTAPGDGICLRDYTLSVNANNVIIRFIRSRYGDAISTNEDDAIHGMGDYKNIIIDHCSFSWSIDETASFYNNENFTMQWCLISESLYASIHDKGNHGYGGIWGGTNASFHHNLLAHHSSRNPRFAGGQTTPCINVDFRNNAIYNWGFNSAYGGEEGKINMVANYYKYGPATKTGVRARILDASSNPTEQKGVGQFFVDQNYVEGFTAITANNWAGGVQGASANDPKAKATTPFPYEPIELQTAEQAYNSILKVVGCNFPKRDAIDARIIEETRTGTAKYGATFEGGGKGIINSQSEVGGWPELKSTTAAPDMDKDGMPDEWEKAKGLNPNDKTDGNKLDTTGYTMLEMYLNELVSSSITDVKDQESIPVGFQLNQNYPNPFNPETTIGYRVQASSNVSLKVYDVLGREVATLVNNYHPAGTYKIAFNVEARHGASLQSGVYFYRMQTPSYTETKKMLLVK